MFSGSSVLVSATCRPDEGGVFASWFRHQADHQRVRCRSNLYVAAIIARMFVSSWSVASVKSSTNVRMLVRKLHGSVLIGLHRWQRLSCIGS